MPLVGHYWADLQSVHGFRCYDNIAPPVLAIGAHDSIAANAKCQLVLAVCLVTISVTASVSSFRLVAHSKFLRLLTCALM